MPDFTQWNVPLPFPNVLYNPAAVDAAIAKTQSELGNFDINRQELQLKRDQFNRQVSEGDALFDPYLNTAGKTGAGGGGGSFLSALANIESGDKNIVSGTDKDSRGLTLAQGGNPAEISQGHFQIQTATWRDFAKQAGVDVNQYPNAISAPREIQARVASVIPFSRFGPRTQTLMRQQFGDIDSSRTVGDLAGLGPRVAPAARAAASPAVAAAPVAPPIVNPNAGPRVANLPGGVIGEAPPAAVASPAAPTITPPTAPGVNPNAAVTIPPPMTTGQADPANVAAVKQASAALLNMPEPDAAAAYPGVVKELQARGFAMNAPPEYPGHAALQAIVGGGQADEAVPVAPSRIALRTGGTDTAGPGAGQTTLPPVEQPNRMYQTGLAGVTIAAPANALAPPPVVAAATPPPAQAQAQAPTTRPPLEPPPSAPTRVIPREEVLPHGLTASQVELARRMVRSGVPVANVAAHIEEWKRANDAGKQQAATQAAQQQKEDYDRQRQYREDVYKREQDAIKNQREEAAAKRAGLPEGYRLDDQGNATRINGLPPDPKVAQAAKDDWDRKQRENPVRGEGLDNQHENTVLQLYPSILDGTATPAQRALYALHYTALKQGPAEWVSDPAKPGSQMLVRVPREIPTMFPSPDYKPGDPSSGAPGSSAGVQPITGATKAPEPKPLPETERKNLLDGGAKLNQVVTSLNTFKPEYGGFGSQWYGDFRNMMARASGESPRADWWQDYQRYKLQVRQGISGQSLTASELGEFDKADINPGMAPSTIAANLRHQQALIEQIHNRRIKSLEADGYNAGAINAAGGERPASPASTAPTSASTSGPIAAARDAIAKGAPRDAVIKRLRDNGIDPGGL